MSEADDNHRKQSEALGRVLAEAMDGDRLHPDNQPQVGTRLDAMCDVCGRAFAEHRSGLLNEAYCPRFIEAHWYGWLPTTFVPQPTPAEPRIETVHDSFTCETPNCPACWGESKQEGVEGDYVGIGRNGPTPRVEAGAQPEPEELAEFEKFWGRVEFDDWPIDWKKAKKIWDAAQQSLKDAPTEEETVWVIEHSAHGGEWRPVGCIFYNSPNAENDARRQLAYLNNNGHKDFAVRVSRYERSNGRARAGSSRSKWKAEMHIGPDGEPVRGASPPSSPSAAQTCPTCGSDSKKMYGTECWGNPQGVNDPWHESSSLGAPQEQK